MTTIKTAVLLGLIFLVLAGCTQNNPPGNDMNNNTPDRNSPVNNNSTLTVQNGSQVQVNYRGTLEDGTEFDSSLRPGREPLAFTVGAGQMIPGFDAAVVGMREGEEKTVTLSPTEAYGEERADLIREIPRSQFGREWNDLAVGNVIMASSGQRGTIIAKSDTNATVNFNHELAGKTLVFWIQMVSIQQPS